MKVILAGHYYQLGQLDIDSWTYEQFLQFVDRGHGRDTPGTTNQEVLRVLINRVNFLNEELPDEVNEKILYHLRMALTLHETRALLRKVEKGTLKPESISTNPQDLHFLLFKEE